MAEQIIYYIKSVKVKRQKIHLFLCVINGQIVIIIKNEGFRTDIIICFKSFCVKYIVLKLQN